MAPNDEWLTGQGRLVRSGLTDDGLPAYVLETSHSGPARRVEPVGTDVEPLDVTEPVLAPRLMDQFRSQLRTHLTGDELEFLDSLADEPRLDVAVLDGAQVLQMTYFGGQSSTRWDGTAEDAEDIVGGMADWFAGSISSHHWHHAEGWRSWRDGADSP